MHVLTVNVNHLGSRCIADSTWRCVNDVFLGIEALRQTVLIGLTTKQLVTITELILKKGKLNSVAIVLATLNYCDGKL